MRRLTCLLLSALLLFCCTGCQREESASLELFAMDTYMTLSARGEGAQDALTAVSREINRLEQLLSRTLPDSDVSRLNLQGSAQLNTDTAALLQQAVALSRQTEGAFDVTVAPLVSAWAITSDTPRVPSPQEIAQLLPLVGSDHITVTGSTAQLDEHCAIDLGGIGKGYASDRAAQLLKEHGIEHAAISLGGNVYVAGTRPDGTPWQVGLQDPANTGSIALRLTLSDRFAVTSGGYQRYFTAEDGTVYQHILDPKTGYPAQSDLLSVTIVSRSGTAADAYSTALYVMGQQEAILFWKGLMADGDPENDFDMILINNQRQALYTPGLAEQVTLEKESSYVLQALTA